MMLGYCLGRTSLGGTQPWEVLHSQMSVKAGGIGWSVSPLAGTGKRTEDLEYSMALVSKAAAVFERMGASFGGSSVGERLSNSIIGYRERPFSERKSQSMWLVFFSNEVPFHSSMYIVL